MAIERGAGRRKRTKRRELRWKAPVSTRGENGKAAEFVNLKSNACEPYRSGGRNRSHLVRLMKSGGDGAQEGGEGGGRGGGKGRGVGRGGVWVVWGGWCWFGGWTLS